MRLVGVAWEGERVDGMLGRVWRCREMCRYGGTGCCWLIPRR
jgi:hypothetical protein